MPRKLVVLGLDSAPPKLMYGELGQELEFLGGITRDSARYLLRSTHPPITIPAWICGFTGKTPGELGLYGFRHRRPGDVAESYIVTSKLVKERTLWEVASSKGLRPIVVGVPPTYPPKPFRGYLITDFITPGPDKPYTWPPALKNEISRLVGDYVFDVVYRSEDKGRVAEDLWRMTEKRFKVLKHLMRKKWDLFIYVEIGVDRLHHAFWKYFDTEHPRYEYHEVYSRVIPEYFKLLDTRLRELSKEIPKDAVVVVMSDHGVKAMKGAFTINQWLIQEGYLKLEEEPRRPGTELRELKIDWSRTVAWGWGGYYARVFINLKGREPRGVVSKEDYEDILSKLKHDLMKVRGPNGEVWKTKVFEPRELYPVVRGDPPDLMVYLDDLNWRAAGTLGWDSLYLPENDRGPDDAVHDWLGVLSIHDPERTLSPGDKGEVDMVRVYGLLSELMGLGD